MKGSEFATKLNKNSCCRECRKKTIILVSCKCSEQFCIKCRYPEDHGCKFNYSENGKEQLRKENPSVVGEKISKI